VSALAKYVDWHGVRTAVVNASSFVSDVADKLLRATSLDGTRLCDCVLVWHRDERNTLAPVRVSLRSRAEYDDQDNLLTVSSDVDALARLHGGGGHVSAAGFGCQDLDVVLGVGPRPIQ
jgi:hypothetical protein